MISMKKMLSCLLALALTAALAAPMAAAAYSDVPAGSALAAEVQKASNYGLMNGYSAGKFGYSDSMTRVQFVTAVGRMLGWFEGVHGTVPQIPAAMRVPDTMSSTYLDAILFAVEYDVVDTDRPFRPNDPVTRGEMSEILVRALGLKEAAAIAEKQNSLPFTDVTSGRGYISVAYAIGMTNGISATAFAPDNHATRAQAAAMLVRIYEKLKQRTDWVHGFYAISSYSQLSLADSMDAVSAGWSRMTWDGSAAKLATTSANQNEYYVPTGYQEVADRLQSQGKPLHLEVYMDTSGGLRDMLASAGGRAQAVEEIMAELTVSYNAIGRNPYSGVTIDFEGLRAAQRDDFTAFLQELSAQLRRQGKSLYVCVAPVLTTGAYYDGYDYRAIGDLADKVILMAHDYDARDLSGFEGSDYQKTTASAPLGQVYMSMQAITDKSTGVRDLSKIALGFSCKNIAWLVDANGKLLSGTPVYPTNETVYRRLNQADTVHGWSGTYHNRYAIYTAENGERWYVLYEDGRSVQAKVNAAKLLGITGVSLWRLGTIPAYSDWNWTNILKK